MINKRNDLIKYIKQKYNIEAIYPWQKYPNFCVFKHLHNNKWFGIIMNVSMSKLGEKSMDYTDILNVKCEPTLVEILSSTKGIYRAYHMNKNNWITIDLNSSFSTDEIKKLIQHSFELTK